MGGGIFKSMPQSISSFTSVSDDKKYGATKAGQDKKEIGWHDQSILWSSKRFQREQIYLFTCFFLL